MRGAGQGEPALVAGQESGSAVGVQGGSAWAIDDTEWAAGEVSPQVLR